MQKNLKVVVIDESGQLSVFPKLNKLVRMLTTNMSNKISGNSLASVVQTMDSAIHRINHYPVDKH